VAQGAVLLIHSFAWHSEIFAEVAIGLKQRRFSVVAYDWQGHGLSGSTEKTRGDLRRFEYLIGDAEKMMQFVRRRFPRLPLFVLGEGFGGSVALHVAARNDRIDGVIVCNPFVMPSLDPHPPSHITPVLFALEKLMPDLRISTVEAAKMHLSEDLDPSITQTPTLRFFVQAHKSLRKLEKRLRHIKCPFVTLHGMHDNRASFKHSRELFNRARSQDKTLMIYENMDSVLFGELEEDRSHVLTDIMAWLDARTRTPVNSPRDKAASSSSQPMFRNHTELHISPQQQRILSLMNRNGF